MAEKVMWEPDDPVSVEMLAAELGVSLDEYELRFDVEPVERIRVETPPTLWDTRNAVAVVWRIHYVIQHKALRRVRERDVTVVQINAGGLSGGEGWATCARWLTPSRLDDDALRALLPLMDADAIPVQTFFHEM